MGQDKHKDDEIPLKSIPETEGTKIIDHSTSVSYLELYKFSTCLDKFLLVLAVVFCLISGGSEARVLYLSGKAIGAMAFFATSLDDTPNDILLEKSFREEVGRFGIELAILNTIILIFFYFGTVLFNYTAMRQSFRIRELYFSRVINQDIPWHDQNSTGDFASRIADDLKKIEEGINEKAAMALYHVAIIVICAIQALMVGWKVTLASFATFPIFFVAGGFAGKASTKLAQIDAESSAEAGKIADETFSYIKTVVAFSGQKMESQRYDNVLQTALKNNCKKSFYDALLEGLTNIFIYFVISVVLWYGVRLVMKDPKEEEGYTTETLAILVRCVTPCFFYLGGLAPYFAMFATAKGAAEKIFSTIRDRPIINQSYSRGTKVDRNMKGDIVFDGVSFSYPVRKEVQVLEKFNLNIKSGETVALVGSSGCGKSTLIQLLLRFYDPTAGQIYVDGEDVRDLNLNNLRNQIGMVGQEPVLFDGTITDNIKMGKLAASPSEIEEAAKKANAHNFIRSFPDGYETQIGERGTQLSGGQKQRIAIARALVRKPSILLLDEATSALDSNSESVVQATLEEISRECTTIIVAHKLSTVRRADKIAVLENGRVVEEGSHDVLMAARGAYYKLVELQTSKNEATDKNDVLEDDTETVTQSKDTDTAVKAVDQTSTTTDLNYSSVWKLLRLHLNYKWLLMMGMLSAIITTVGSLIAGFMISKAWTIVGGKDSEYVIHQINLYATYVFVTGVVLVAASRFFRSYLVGVASQQFMRDLKSSMFKTIIHQDIGWFDRSENGVGNLGVRLASEPSSAQMALSLIALSLTSVSLFIFTYVVGIYFSWKLMLAYSAYLPFMAGLYYLEHKVLVKEIKRNSDVLEISTKLAVETINNVRTVASLSTEQFFLNRYIAELKTYKNKTIRNIHIRGLVNGLTKSLFTFSFLVTIFYGTRLILAKECSVIVILTISDSFLVATINLMFTAAFLPNVIAGLIACSPIYDLLSQSGEPPTSQKRKSKELVEGDIEYKSVEFSYPTRPDVKILQDLNLSVMRGKTVALVGPSGCGKSTIVQLLERFYDPQLGIILFGEYGITKVNLETLRFSLGIVMQEPNLFSRTIAENIAYGDTSRVVPRNKIIQSAQKANIHNFISSLPLGYDTVLGERGTQLSGGQKQRIAIARAIVRDPEVLLLDEATSALDSESEKVVQEALNSARENRTCIVIAHRLETIVDSDVIAVISEGRVAEKGTHQELMDDMGLYWQLYNKQHSSNE